MTKTWKNLTRDAKTGLLVPAEHGTGRKRQATQHATNRLVRRNGGDPLVQGVTSTPIPAAQFAAVARSPKAMVKHFDQINENNRKLREWRKQANQSVD